MRKWIFIFILLSFRIPGFAQIQFSEGSSPRIGQRIYFGGNFSFQLGTITYIDVSPLAGYMINKNLSAGAGITYRYLKDKYFDYQTNIYGGRMFIRHNLPFLPMPLFAYSEYEDLNLEYAVYNNTGTDFVITRGWIPSLFIGGGLFQPVGNRAGFMITALYNLLYDAGKSPYNSAWVFRVGFTL